MFGTVVGAIKLFGIGKSLIGAAIVLVALGTVGGIIYHRIWERGYDRAIADIARQDDRATKRAASARSVVLDCKSRGLLWDQSTGICERR